MTKIAWHDFHPIGGLGDIVEVDETLLFRRKYNVGRLYSRQRQHLWLFGGVSRTTGRVFGQLVPNRKRETLFPVMEQCIDDDSFINSDMWRAYNGCDVYFRGHGVVNHSRNFVQPPRNQDPMWFPRGYLNEECLDKQFIGPAPMPQPPLFEEQVPVRWHTQKCERSWLTLKRISRRCTDVESLDRYIGEWMYRTNTSFQQKSFAQKMRMFLNDIRRAHPGLGKNPMEDDVLDCHCHECLGD